jgi:hypothetical protein
LAIRYALDFEHVAVVIKSHVRQTRVFEIEAMLAELPPSHASRVRLVEDVDSLPLILWADLVLDVASGISFDAVRRGKPVIVLDHIDSNRATLSHYLSCCRCEDRDAFAQTFSTLVEGQLGKPFYDPEELSRFVTEVIEPNGPDVLDDYVQLLSRGQWPIAHI